MAFISEEDRERVRNATDLVQLVSERTTVKKSGRRYKACCPFHQEKTPSFYIDPDMGRFHCFGCGEDGDVFNYVMKMENMDFPDAVRYLAERAHIQIAEIENGSAHPRGYKERLYECMKESATFFHTYLMRSAAEDAAKARAYLAGRGMGSDICKRWNLGYAPGHGTLVAHLSNLGFTQEEMLGANVALQGKNGKLRDRFFERVMFPIQDRSNKTVAFGGRIIGAGEPKYLNTAETPLFTKSRNLYGIERAKDTITSSGCAIICEGYTDTIALHEAGFTNAVATLGTALTAQHLRVLRTLRPKKILYLFDGDSAGQKAADRASEFIDIGITPESGSDYIAFEVAVLPEGKDPAEFLASDGKEAMQAQLNASMPLITFAIDRRLADWDLTDPVQRNSAIRAAVALLAPIKDSIIAADYTNYIADRLGCGQEIVAKALRSARPLARQGGEDERAPYFKNTPSTQETDADRCARECLSLCLRVPSLIVVLKEEGSTIQWPNTVAQKVADALLKQQETLSPFALADVLEKQVPGAGAYLGAWTVEVADEDTARANLISLLTRVRENDLVERIRLGNYQLKNDHNLSENEYDTLFKNVTALQKELNKLRNA